MNIKKTISIAMSLGVLTAFFVVSISVNQEAQARIWTIENCVMDKWASWEEIRGLMPSKSDERMFRDECWEQMGASLN